jgi:hypothetical protein
LTITKQSPNLSIDNRQCALVITLLCVFAGSGEARQSPEAIARSIVIGQVYASGNVYVAGFDENEKRAWPDRVHVVPLRAAATRPWFADFVRRVAQDSEEQYYFPQREDRDPSVPDVFSTLDRAALEDRNLARYRSTDLQNTAMSIFAWDERLGLTDISFRDSGQLRPTTAPERAAIVADRKQPVPQDFECTTVPQFLDAATVILTATIAASNVAIRLSEYATPGCAGHLSEIYVLDVIVPGQEPRRFEFRHYQGVL